MKKVLILHSSKRKMNTYGLLLQVEKILEEKNIQVEILDLHNYKIDYCIGCEHCIVKNACVLKDDVDFIMNKMIEADGIIISSPVYLKQVSGILKTFIDRTCKWYHRPVLYGKPILTISTTKGSGLKDTLDYMTSVTIQWGAMAAGKIGRNIRNIDKKVKERDLKKFLSLMEDASSYNPKMSELINFEVQKSLAQMLSGLDKQYWEEKNWMNEKYYFPCKIKGYKCIIPIVIGKIIRKAMGKKAIELK